MIRTALLATIVAFGIALSACGSDSGPGGGFGGTGEIRADIDGVPFSATVGMVALLDGTLNLGNIGQDDAQLQFNSADVGTYDLNLGAGAMGEIDQLSFRLDGVGIIGTVQGSITVEMLSGSGSEGTFSAVAGDGANTYQITNGVFIADF